MKILHVYKDYYPPILGGIETHINLLCKYLKDKVEIEVLVANRSNKTEIEEIDGIKITKVAQWGRIMSAPLTPEFHKYLKKISADIYHFHHPNPSGEMAYLMAGSPGKAVVTYHSDIIRQSLILPIYRPFLYKFLKKCTYILPTSPNYIESSPILRDFKEKCQVIPLGIEIEKFQLQEEWNSRIQMLRDQYSPYIVLFVGRLRYYKGLPILIEAIKAIQDIHLLIIGTAPLPSEQEQYTQMVHKLGIDNKVHFLGEISDNELPLYYHACDVFCLPSTHRSEAYGVVQLEAQACGKPVISTSLDTGVPYVNLDGKTGLLVKPGSVEELKGAILRLKNNPDLTKQLGNFAQKRVTEEFSSRQMAEKVFCIYQKLHS